MASCTAVGVSNPAEDNFARKAMHPLTLLPQFYSEKNFREQPRRWWLHPVPLEWQWPLFTQRCCSISSQTQSERNSYLASWFGGQCLAVRICQKATVAYPICQGGSWWVYTVVRYLSSCFHSSSWHNSIFLSKNCTPFIGCPEGKYFFAYW